ncbi:MAG: hypothetical protein HY518_00545 [Candidatus Aenigmarchaeota archaeon]|nr:hypothetical protein [Candidatus Aenigmarchaeota archaeon]
MDLLQIRRQRAAATVHLRTSQGGVRYTLEAIYAAATGEPRQRGYVPLCTRRFDRVTGGPPPGDGIPLDGLDRSILPYAMEHALLGDQGCGSQCPGFDPIPVEPFSVRSVEGRNYIVKCKRFVPRELVEGGTRADWKALRDAVTDSGGRIAYRKSA